MLAMVKVVVNVLVFVLVGSKVETQLESPSTIQAPTATGSVTRSSTGENRETLINGIIGYYEVDRTTCLKGKQGCNSIDILNLGHKNGYKRQT